MLKSRRIRFETLEERNLLTAVPGTASAAELPQPTGANTWVVTTLSDTVDESDGFLSLREAVDRAMDGDMITFSSSLYGGTIRLNNGYIKISRAITITGSNLASSGVNGITISGAGRSRVFYTAVQNGIVTLDYINITNGNAGDGGEGSGIYNTGGLLLDHCALSACTATGHSYGGALRNRGGSVNVTNCSFSNNSSYLGAGISNKTGTVTVTDSSFTGNTTTANGGALYNEGILLITSTTITGNRAVSGGAIRNFGTMTVTNSRITGNVASDLGGGIWSSGTTTVRNCTVASNSASQGGGIYHDASESGSLLLYNTIVYPGPVPGSPVPAGRRPVHHRGLLRHRDRLEQPFVENDFRERQHRLHLVVGDSVQQGVLRRLHPGRRVAGHRRRKQLLRGERLRLRHRLRPGGELADRQQHRRHRRV